MYLANVDQSAHEGGVAERGYRFLGLISSRILADSMVLSVFAVPQMMLVVVSSPAAFAHAVR